MGREPNAAARARFPREREFAMTALSAIEPRGGIAKTFASIAAPGRGAALHIGGVNFLFSPFRAPTELTFFALANLSGELLLPRVALGVRQTYPGKVKQFVNQDALELARLGKDIGVEQNQAARDRSCRGMRSQRGTNFDTKWTSF